MNKTVLVVDDDQINRIVLKRSFEKAGLEVVLTGAQMWISLEVSNNGLKNTSPWI